MPKIIGTPFTKFPKYIRDDCAIDPPDHRGDRFTFETGQREDHRNALTYLEQNVLGKSPEEWDAKTVIEIITNLHKIAGRSVLTHPCSQASQEDVTPGAYRKYMAQAIREQSSGENYDIGCLGSVFYSLIKSHNLLTASNYVKWFLKFSHTMKGTICTAEQLRDIDQEFQEILTPLLDSAAMKQWRDENFEGRTLNEWFFHFINGPGKQYYKTEDGKDQKSLREFYRVDMADRACRAGLYTPNEEQARDLVIKFFMSPDKVPGAMGKICR